MTGVLRLLGAAASYSELAFVYFEADDLRYWGIHRRAVSSLDSGLALAMRWMEKFEPMLVVVPDHGEKSRKGSRARALIESSRRLPTKKASTASAVIFPQLAQRVPPPRKAWDTERRGVVLFEAVSVTNTWLWQNRQGILPLPF